MQECRNCFAANAVNAKFCDQCGTRLGAPATHASTAAHRDYTPRHLVERVLNTRAAIVGEKKRVTVMFVDIKGSTRLAEQAGAEAWHGILDRYFVMLSAAVHRYEGTVNQYTGDGIMALFGAPIAHEDHAVRAAWAALQIQRDVRAYADELRLQSGLNLSARIGLNSGEVVVGSIGDDLRMDYTAQGLTVHLAARVEQLCEPGRVFVTRNTAVQIDGYFRLRDLGETHVAGSDAALRIYELEGEGAAKSRLQRALNRGAARFVGRDAELLALQAALQGSRQGQGRIVTVVGEAGIGKSRLCHEFAADCERQGLKVLRAAAVPYASALPLLPVLALLRQRLGLPEQGNDDNVAESRRLAAGSLLLFDSRATALLPPLLDFLGIAEATVTAPRPQPSPADRSQLLELLARLLAGTPAQPQLLLIEDLQFVDAATEQFLAVLGARIVAGGNASLLLCNHRPEYPADWLSALPHERIDARALDDAQIEAVARDLLGDDASIASLPRQLRERATGNPFYVEEAVQALTESGHLQGQPGAHRLDRAIERWPIPDTVHALVAARIDRLDAGDKSALQAAAVIGQRFTLAALAQLLEQPPDECRDSLLRLALRRFVECGEPDCWRFVQPLIQDVAYRTQLERNRSEVHQRFAALLERTHSLSGPPSEAAAGIALHWRRAAQWQRAAAWNIQAARWAMEQDATTITRQYRLAREHTGRAPRSPEIDRLRVIALAGLVRMAQFTDVSAEEAQSAYEEARAICEDNGDTQALAELLISYGSEHLHRGDAAAAVKVAAEAVQLALDAGANALIERFRLSLLLIHGTAGYPREGLQLIERVSGAGWLNTPIDDDNVMSRGFSSMLLGWLGRIPEAEAQLAAALAYAEREQRPASWMYAISVDLALLTGDHRNVLANARQAMLQAETHGSPYFRAIALRALGQAHLLDGDAAAALPLLQQAMPLVAPGGHAHQFQSRTLSSLAMAWLGMGDIVQAEATASEAVDCAQRSHSRVWEIMAWISYLKQPVDGPAKSRAAEGLARVAELIEQAGADGARPWLWLAHSQWARDDSARMQALSKAREGFAAIGAEAQVRLLSLAGAA